MKLPQKIQNSTTIRSSNSASGYLSERNEITISIRYQHPMFIAALFTTANTWKQPRCPSTDNGIKKMWYYYSVIIKELLFMTRWMELEGTMLCEISQRKDKYCMISLYEESKKLTHRYRTDWWLPRMGSGGWANS